MALQLVKKWGNSPAIRLPAAVMEAAHLKLDQAVEVRAENGRIVIEPAPPTYTLDDLLAGITAQNLHAFLFDETPDEKKNRLFVFHRKLLAQEAAASAPNEDDTPA